MEEKQNRHIILWVIITILLLAVAGSVGYIYLNKTEQADEADAEKTAWMKIQKWEGEMQLDSLQAAIKMYQTTFVHGRHADMVEELRLRIESEITDWNTALYAESVEEMEDFIRNHSDSYYRHEANRKIDSLSFVEASYEDTYDAYVKYLDSFSEGIYAAQAKKRMEDLDNGTLSDKENDYVVQVIERHFTALAANDAQTLATTVAPVLTSYIGQSGAGKADVEKYMQRIHADDNRSINFYIKNTIITKEVNAHKPTYIAHFTLNEQISQSGQTNTMNFTALARLNDELQITSLMLSQQ